jgi:hypothetical protein
MDLPATLLYLYGIPIPEDYDGRLLQEAFNNSVLNRRPIAHQPGDGMTAAAAVSLYSKSEQAELNERLRLLGYLN